MAELARPYADAEEASYIYMFWLTPAPRQAPVSAPRRRRARPTHQTRQPSMMDALRPKRSDTGPDTSAPSHEPAAMAAVMPPWSSSRGSLQSAPDALSPWLT